MAINWLSECERSIGVLIVAIMWLSKCDNQSACWAWRSIALANVSDQLACWDWQSIGWASVAIAWQTGNGGQLGGPVRRSVGVLGMAVN